jgi:hypothetical protein
LVRRNDGLASMAVGIHGFDAAAVHRSARTNAMGAKSATPYVARRGKIDLDSVFISLLAFGVSDFDYEELRHVVTGLEVSGRQIVLCIDEHWWFVQMDTPTHVDLTLGGRKIQGAVRAARVSPDGSRFTLAADGQAHT